LLAAFPDAPISLDHCAFPDPAAPATLFDLARYPNLHMKVTTHLIDAATGHDGSAGPFMARLVEVFGAERLMWGSDFCQTHDRPYAALVALAQRAFGDLSALARDAILGATAARLFVQADARRGRVAAR
jgi:L-fuconolactonase